MWTRDCHSMSPPLPPHPLTQSIQDYGGLLGSSLLPINKSPGERQDAHANEERNADGYHHFRPCWVPAECDLSFGHAVLQPRDNGVLLVFLVVPGGVADFALHVHRHLSGRQVDGEDDVEGHDACRYECVERVVLRELRERLADREEVQDNGSKG